MTTETVPSLSDLMGEAFNLSLRCAYATICPHGHFFDVRDMPDGELSDKVFAWADGLMGKHYHSRATGHCSLSAMASFDVGDFERETQSDIATFRAFLSEHREPRKMTAKEMTGRGYIGFEA